MRRVEIGNPQTLAGRLGQLAAVAYVIIMSYHFLLQLTSYQNHHRTHQVTRDKLALIAASVPKIAIIHGTEDSLIRHSAGQELHDNLPGSEYLEMEGYGHAIPKQWDGFGDWLVKCIAEGRAGTHLREKIAQLE